MYKVTFSLPSSTAQTPQQWVDQGLTHHRAGRLESARQCYAQAIRQDPLHADAWHLMGVIEHAQGNLTRAIDCMERSLTLNPNNPTTRFNFGNAMRACGRLDAALSQYDAALGLNAHYTKAVIAKAVVLDELDRWDESLVGFSDALRLQDDSAIVFFNRGNGYRKRGHSAQALSDYERALAIQPGLTQALLNRGSIKYEQLQLLDAISDFDAAIRADPENAQAHFNKALTLLLMGDYANGLPLHEWRWKMPLEPGELRNFHQPLWLGQTSLIRKTILIHSEQGLGDCIQFVRYAQQLADLGAIVLLEVPIPLASLLRRAPGVQQVIRRGDPLPAFDVHCPLLSLPLALGTRLESIPTAPCYLKPDPTYLARWSGILGPRTSRLRIGLVWSGSTWHTNDQNRSIRLVKFLQFLPIGPEYVSLQRDVRAYDQDTLAAATHIRHFGSDLSSFEDTSALCRLVDAVVTVDTCVAHLAGALGARTFLLLPHVPDWRWLLDRADTPWYPTMHLLRQANAGDWDGPLRLVALALDEVAIALAKEFL